MNIDTVYRMYQNYQGDRRSAYWSVSSKWLDELCEALGLHRVPPHPLTIIGLPVHIDRAEGATLRPMYDDYEAGPMNTRGHTSSRPAHTLNPPPQHPPPGSRPHGGEHLLTAAGHYLTEQHTTIYGRHWDLTQPDQLREATMWLASQVANVIDYLEQGD